MSLLERIDREIVLADGAMGTLLIERGADPESCLEALCLDSPDIVAQIHSDYAAAGAKIIRTNSFRANSLHLGKFRLGHRVNEINWQAAQIARQAVKGLGVTVAGSVGPIGDPELSDAEKSDLFRAQIGALLDGGAQMIFLETFQDPDELILALEVKYSLHHCPAVCSMAFNRTGKLPDGTTIAEAFDKLRRNDAEIVGMNCSNGPGELIALLKSLEATACRDRVIQTLPLAVLPNAGLPEFVGGKARYSLTPEDFASAAVTISTLGPRIIGGCCGTTPAHIAAAARALKSI